VKKIWGFKLKPYNFFLTVTMAVANIIMNYAAQYMNRYGVPMPLWLDSVGIIVAAMEAGPIAGALAGFPLYGIYLFSDHGLALFSINSVLIGIAAGVFARTIGVTNWKKALLVGIIAALIDIALSSAFDLYLTKGYPGFVLGDMVFRGLLKMSAPAVIASLTSETVMSIPDKIISALLAYMICSSYAIDKAHKIPADTGVN